MISMTKLGIAVAVGAADEALEYMDSTAKDAAGLPAPRTGHFKTWRDYGRIAMPLGGLALAMWKPGKFGTMGEAIAQSSTPFLVKSIIKMVRTSPYTQQVGGPRVQQQINRPAQRVGTLMHQEEFKQVRAL